MVSIFNLSFFVLMSNIAVKILDETTCKNDTYEKNKATFNKSNKIFLVMQPLITILPNC